MTVPHSIARYLTEHSVPFSTLAHPVAFSAQRETAAAHVRGHQWAKTVVCFADDKPILAVLPAPCSVDLEQLRKLASAQTIRLAREDELAALYPDSEPGAMPPLGPLYGQRVVVDHQLGRSTEIVFDAGTHTDAIRMSYADFERLVHPLVGDFAS